MTMSTIVLLLVVAIVIGIVVWWAFGRGNRSKEEPALPKQRSIRELEPGDALSYWDGTDDSVHGLVAASEAVNARASSWRWAFLDNDRLLEAAPDGLILFGDPEIIHQGTAEFEKFVPPDGALATFEQRVREGVIGRNPVTLEHRGRHYIIRSTGTFAGELKGDAGEREVWRDIAEDPSQNVYFEMQAAPDQEEAGDREVLGIWTTHLLLYYGVPFDESTVKGLYTR